MPSMKRFIGKITASRALKRKMTRYGRSVTSQSLELEKKRSEKAKKIIEEELENIAQQIETGRTLKGRKISEKNLKALENQKYVLSVLRSAGERPVHASELAAALAFEVGFKRKNLLPKLNSARNIKKRLKTIYEGSINTYIPAVRQNLLDKVHRLLSGAKNKALTSNEIAEGLGYNLKKMSAKKRIQTRSDITTILALLDLMNLVRKLPSKKTRFVWIHSDYKLTKTTLPKWNIGWQILQELKQGPKKLSDLTTYKILGQSGGRKKTLGTQLAVRDWLSNLEASGLIYPQRLSGPGRRYEFRLTNEAKSLLSKQEGRDSLLPSLRKALLGAVIIGLKPIEEKMYARIVKWTKTMIAIEENPEATYREISEIGGMSYTHIPHVRFKGAHPHRNVGEVKLKKYLLVMRKRNPKEAKWFEKWLKKNRPDVKL